MIETTIERWHQYLRGDLDGGLDELLHPDCVFLSPIVFTPQQGREVTKLYLQAAGATFTQGADEQSNGGDDQHGGGTSGAKVPGAFRYVKQVLTGNHAVLEFETTMDGTYVNGVDIITCDDDGLIVEFKVMLRPLQAVNLVHAQMKAMLERMS